MQASFSFLNWGDLTNTSPKTTNLLVVTSMTIIHLVNDNVRGPADVSPLK
jgi:hypothetical protein